MSALLGLAGCGGSADPLHAVRKAATNTLTLTAQSTLTLTDTRLFGGNPGPIIGRGEFSFPKGLGYEALKVPALDGRAPGTAYFVFLPRRLWVRPMVSTALPAGDLWVSARFAGSQPASSTTSSLALVVEGMNPQLLLEELASGAVSASASGQRVVDHVPFTEYVVSVDLERAAASSTAGALRRAMQHELAALHATNAGSLVRIEAGVDGTGRVSQLQAVLPGSRLGTVQIALWKFGSAIPLSLPLASQTVEIERLRGIVTAASVLTGG